MTANRYYARAPGQQQHNFPILQDRTWVPPTVLFIFRVSRRFRNLVLSETLLVRRRGESH